jgi:predicted ATPase
MEDAAKVLGMTHNEIEAIRELRKLRNGVAHSIEFSLTRADAIRFSEIADDLILRIWQLKENAKGR